MLHCQILMVSFSPSVEVQAWRFARKWIVSSVRTNCDEVLKPVKIWYILIEAKVENTFTLLSGEEVDKVAVGDDWG